METTLLFISNLVFVMALGWYLITNLQWYDYKIERVVLKHHKWSWHLFYFIIPFFAYYVLGKLFWIPLFLLYLPALIFWNYRLDKRLVVTWRVKRFLSLLLFLALFFNFLCLLKGGCAAFGVFIPLALAYAGSMGIEKFLFAAYKKEAKKKLRDISKLQIVAVTGSYGKTSMKNFIAEVLSQKYRVYATPRSVNTIGGIIRDINESLPDDTEVYICEAGARMPGDIYEITQLLNPQTVVVGKVGPQHLEYFKSLENIKRTKLEIIHSERLENAFVHCSVTDEPHEKVTFFGDGIENVVATLEGLDFDLKVANGKIHLHSSILGSFNAININAAVLVAFSLGLSEDEVVRGVSLLKSVEHRLQRIDAGGKIILDDGYNGNIDGILEGIRLCSLHKGRKVIVTPGLVESTEELNLKLIESINKIFDLAIVTGTLNSELFEKYLEVNETVMLKDKTGLTKILGEKTRSGDIIYFANDAPNFI
ncbi:MAG: UDP-N-acetylmuramoylalanyl-D-glutamyl-2, 6-diaminopimelate--D-alanyl-D-alanine ligase [Helicobacteraceae bacterium 4484_230]|nr:MAG: UDP-N-acetylmuramoylalanyl-D-glutamyl-2, 6-diaminopimelate--D-alanyl-D-alanine ligase [Helicobacteraceae bacterium 4484_230]